MKTTCLNCRKPILSNHSFAANGQGAWHTDCAKSAAIANKIETTSRTEGRTRKCPICQAEWIRPHIRACPRCVRELMA